MNNLIVDIAKNRFQDAGSQIVHFVDNDEANSILNDLDRYPHAYVLACLMDRQIRAERAWNIPYEIFTQPSHRMSEITLSRTLSRTKIRDVSSVRMDEV